MLRRSSRIANRSVQKYFEPESADVELETYEILDKMKTLAEKETADCVLGENLVDVKLDFSARPKLVINATDITRMLADKINHGIAVAPNEDKDEVKGNLPDPALECEMIVRGLFHYVQLVLPTHSINLFHLPKRVKGIKRQSSWEFVSKLFDKKLEENGVSSDAFVGKMTKIMKTCGIVDPHNWTVCHVGYILAYWISKLYINIGINDEQLPTQLQLGKTHFLELYGEEYDEAILEFPESYLGSAAA